MLWLKKIECLFENDLWCSLIFLYIKYVSTVGNQSGTHSNLVSIKVVNTRRVMYKVHSDKAFEEISQIETNKLWKRFFLKVYFAISDALRLSTTPLNGKLETLCCFKTIKWHPKLRLFWSYQKSEILPNFSIEILETFFLARSGYHVRINLHFLNLWRKRLAEILNVSR